LGTNLDNVRDREAKGRNIIQRGEAHPLHKLTKADIVEIRRLHLGIGVDQRTLARQFGVSQHHISRIVRYRCWPEVP
jgi:hypothetical protein